MAYDKHSELGYLRKHYFEPEILSVVSKLRGKNMEIMKVDEIFEHLCSSLRVKHRVESVSELFAKQTNDSDRVEIARQLLEEHNLNVIHNTSEKENGKSYKRSVDLRNSGNKSFQMKDDRTALVLYTQSIATAPFPGASKISDQELQTQLREKESNSTSEALALALANRSAVFFSMGNHEACLRDIRQALKYSYPKKLLYKLFERQGKCLQALGRIESAMDSLHVSTNILNT
jgi:tetratricopeptide (TPR) repeat protein